MKACAVTTFTLKYKLANGVWKSQKKSHFTTLRAKRATFIFWTRDFLSDFQTMCSRVAPNKRNTIGENFFFLLQF